MTKQRCFMSEIAVAKSGIAGWEPCIWDASEFKDATVIQGGIPTIGARGKKRWPPRKQLTKVLVTDAELQAAKVAYEKETGLCGECQGSGQEVAGWSVSDGPRHRACSRCKGTMKATTA